MHSQRIHATGMAGNASHRDWSIGMTCFGGRDKSVDNSRHGIYSKDKTGKSWASTDRIERDNSDQPTPQQATASEPQGSAQLPPSATIHLLRLLLQLMFLNLAPPIRPATHRGLCCVHGCKVLFKHCVSATDWVLFLVQITSCSLETLRRWNCQSRRPFSCCSVIAMNGQSQVISTRTLRPWTRFFHQKLWVAPAMHGYLLWRMSLNSSQ